MNVAYMDLIVVFTVLVLAVSAGYGRMVCDRGTTPIEMGEWKNFLIHLDTVTIENPPIKGIEGQSYVYENYFPNTIIRYIHVDNLAMKSCGASASIKAGGINTSGVLVVLHSPPNHEIRSVIDVWGTKNNVNGNSTNNLSTNNLNSFKKLRSRYLSQGARVSQNSAHNFRESSKYLYNL